MPESMYKRKLCCQSSKWVFVGVVARSYSKLPGGGRDGCWNQLSKRANVVDCLGIG